MKEELLTETMVIHIEREFARNIDTDAAIDEFDSLKKGERNLNRDCTRVGVFGTGSMC
ncbi:hypothetical protein Sjap_015752 [Stephania japonica]|uniref:Uncharacterized protein n=1 Tax=Stephania japonica TaxID=461633 RepID=A0AAP0IKI7_9MAGN